MKCSVPSEFAARAVRSAVPAFLFFFCLLFPGSSPALAQGLGPDGAGAGDNQKRNARATLVVYNSADALSETLARFYAKQRDIPGDQVFGIPTSIEEEISREEYDKTIAEPLRKAFKSNRWWLLKNDPASPEAVIATSIRFVVLMRGIPLKIRDAPGYVGDSPDPMGGPMSTRNEASVDSELATLGGFSKRSSGVVPSPYYRSYTRITDAPIPWLLLVCRLDAPTGSIVRRMITDSMETEQTGLWGRAYVDARGIAEGGYAEGDKWLAQVAADLRAKGISTVFDNGPQLFPPHYPMREAALYYGWYSENIAPPFNDPDFAFRKGAIAMHLHSFSATTVRDPLRAWVGPLLSKGAAATVGNVYEPYLSLTHDLAIFNDRLLAGFTLGEAAYMALRGLSWMNVTVGDPLYQPFRALNDLSMPEPDGKETAEWVAYREAALIWKREGATAGTKALQKAGTEKRSGIIYEGLGLLQLAGKQWSDASRSFESARKYYGQSADSVRVTINEIQALRDAGRKQEALKLTRASIPRYSALASVAALRALEVEMDPPPPPATPAPSTPPPVQPPTRPAIPLK